MGAQLRVCLVVCLWRLALAVTPEARAEGFAPTLHANSVQSIQSVPHRSHERAAAAANHPDIPQRVLGSLCPQQLPSIAQEADFWQEPTAVNSTVDVMVGPQHTVDFEAFLRNNSFPFEIAIHDLKQKLIEKEGDPADAKVSRAKRILMADIARDGFGTGLMMGEYYRFWPLRAYDRATLSYATIVSWIKNIADHMPRMASILDIGRTSEGRDIFGIKFGRDDGRKPIMVVDAGIHAREWTSIHTAMYFINLVPFAEYALKCQIANGHHSDPNIKSYLDNTVLYIFPVLNPDGYEYTRNDRTNPRARMWRKSRSSQRCAWDGRSTRCCKGVDLNRNFDFRFGETGTSHYPCSEIFRGDFAESEPETKAFANFLRSVAARMKTYITLHAYSQLWIYSYSHRRFTYPVNIQEIRSVAARAVDALGREFGTRYQYGTGPEIIYAFSGGSTDYATEKLHTKYSYTIELRPNYQGINELRDFDFNGFVLDKRQLIPTAKETWAGVKVVFDQVVSEYRAQMEKEAAFEERRIALKGKCSDTNPNCHFWLSENPKICTTAASAMRRDCPNMCDVCHLVMS